MISYTSCKVLQWEDRQWWNVQWEAKCRNVDVDVDVDVVLREHFGRQVFTTPLMRRKHEPDEGTMKRFRDKLVGWLLDGSDDNTVPEIGRAKDSSTRGDAKWPWEDLMWRWRDRTGEETRECSTLHDQA